ncbi:hypothetical protein GCM10012279_01450 [Micromonospora yangpuensis]|nr:hypothetical protein GCM10012279_01450 [Micromonospora yangpuensis]
MIGLIVAVAVVFSMLTTALVGGAGDTEGLLTIALLSALPPAVGGLVALLLAPKLLHRLPDNGRSLPQVKRALREGRCDDPRIDRLARAEAHRLRRMNRWWPWLMSAFVLVQLSLAVFADGLTNRIVGGVAAVVWLGLLLVWRRAVGRADRYLTGL